MDLSNEVAVIFGGLGGIGRATCDYLVTKGLTKLAIIDFQDSEKIQDVFEAFKSVDFIYRKAAIEDRSAVDAALDEIKQKFGFITIVVNAAGIADEVGYMKSLSINLGGVINASLSAVEVMRKDKGGRGGQILNLASILGLIPAIKAPIYCATKWGVVGFTLSLGHPEFEKLTGIAVSCLCPSLTYTNMIMEGIKMPKLYPELQPLFDKINGALVGQK